MARHKSTAYALVLLAAFVLSAAQCDGATAPKSTPPERTLTVIFPTETTKLVGGQSVRVTALLVDRVGQPIEGATVQAELRAPGGAVFATLVCVDKGQGRYLADYVQLPFRGTEGTWRVVARATWDGNQAHVEQVFQGMSSYSERLESLYGFWITLTDLFPYNVPQADDPTIKYWPYEDGNGGMVILANALSHGGFYSSHVILDVHWRHSDWPADEAGAIAYVLSLAGLHHMREGFSPTELAANPTTFRGRPAWRVTGQWAGLNPDIASPHQLEWVVFRCPDDACDWLWTVLISTDDTRYVDDLRALRETFECAAQATEVIQ